MQQYCCTYSIYRAYTEYDVKHNLVTADPVLARQITVKDFSNFHDRFIPNLGSSLHSGHRRESEHASMAAAR